MPESLRRASRANDEKHGGEKFYQVIAVDTFKLPVRTVHKELLTKEGMRMLMGKLRDDGILCYHTSNRYYNLAPIVASVAKDLNYAYIVGTDYGGWDEKLDPRRDRFSSSWVMVAGREALAHLKAPEGVAENKVYVGQAYWGLQADRQEIHLDRQGRKLVPRRLPVRPGHRSAARCV